VQWSSAPVSESWSKDKRRGRVGPALPDAIASTPTPFDVRLSRLVRVLLVIYMRP
jgi:hypothetical protein